MNDKIRTTSIYCFSKVMNAIYLLFKLLPQQHKVVFISRQSNIDTLDFRLIREEIDARNLHKSVFLTKKLVFSPWGMICYFFHMIKQMYHIATSKVVVIDSYCIAVSILKHRQNLKVFQIWHATCAIKKFGYQTIDKKDGTSQKTAKLMKMHQQYTYVLCASDVTSTHFCEAFSVPLDKIVKGGLPRIDYIRMHKQEVGNFICQKYPMVQKKINIVYAPTFRKSRSVDANNLLQAIDHNKYNVIVKTHPLDENISKSFIGNGIIMDQQYSVYDWLSVADIVISDYSALIVEAAVAEIPVYLYIYDIEEYQMNTGLNVSLSDEAIGKYCFRNPIELAKTLDQVYDMKLLHEFRDKYFDVKETTCTKRLVDFIDNMLESENLIDNHKM